MRRFVVIGSWLVALVLQGSPDARAQVPAGYQDLVERLVEVETRISAWEGERDAAYRAMVVERAAIEEAVRSVTEDHLSSGRIQPREALDARFRTERHLGALDSGPDAGDPPAGPERTEAGPEPPLGPPNAAAPGLEIADEARRQGLEAAEEARRRAAEIAEEARQRGREAAEDARERARERADEARERADEAADDARGGRPRGS